MSNGQNNEKKQKNRVVGAVFTAIVVMLGIIYLTMTLTKVDPGYCGVVYSINGGITGETFGQGWHFKKPTERVTDYTIGIEQSYLTSSNQGDSPNDDSFSAPSSDGKGIMMELTFTYRFNEDMITDTFTRFKGRSGADVLTTFIKPNVIAWTKEVTAMYPVSEILGNKRAELNGILSEYLSNKFAPFGIIIENASLIDIRPDDETLEAVTKKVTAQQELELAEIEAQTAKIQANKDKEVALIEAEKNKETAQINAEKLKIEAQGKAEAKKIAAEAEAEANRKIAESLTPELIEKLKYEQWNGELPKVQGSDSSTIIDMRGSSN